MTSHQNPHLDAMIKAARASGTKLLERFHNRAQLLVEFKNPGDLVSLADRESEETIIAVLRQAFPDYGVLGEEGSDTPANDEGYRWIIDPLDATGNFLFGIPFWCVTIALEQHGSVIAGVTYDPVHDELFSAAAGEGTCVNGQPVHTSTRTHLSQAAAGLDIGSPPHPLMAIYSHAFTKSLESCATAFNKRCCALTMAYVASGRIDILAHFGNAKPWDLAAGWLLVTEAGGTVSDIHQKELHLQAGSVLCAANQSLYNQFVPFLKAA